MKLYFQALEQSIVATYRTCSLASLLLNFHAPAVKVQSSKFIGRTFLLGNYNTLHLYPSDNILHYNKRV